MESYLISPKGERVTQIEFYEIGFASKTIVEYYVNKYENIKKDFEEFQKKYTKFDPYFDYLIIKLGYKIKNPFITEEGLLCANGNSFIYKNEVSDKNNYPTASDEDLNISHFDIRNVKDCIISPHGTCYTINRDKKYIHQTIFEMILLESMINSKRIYEDYIDCVSNNEDIYYIINAYFRNRLGYLQVVKYENDAGHILYNVDLLGEYSKNILKTIKTNYPKMELCPDRLPYELMKHADSIKNEMSDLYESRRL